MYNLNENQKSVLFTLLRNSQGTGWRTAKMEISIGESGARKLLARLVKLGLAEGGPNWWTITSEGKKEAERIVKDRQKPKEESQKMF